MVDPMTIMAGGQILNGVTSGLFGGSERRQGKRMVRKGERLMKKAWKERTDYQIPTDITANVSQAERELGAKSNTEQAMQEAAGSELSQNLGAIRRYATSSADALAASSGANSQANARFQQAASAGAQERQQNKQDLD